MQLQTVRLTREELYEKMWSRPAIVLAEEFGISGRGVAKICSRFEIPVCGELLISFPESASLFALVQCHSRPTRRRRRIQMRL